MNDTITFNEVPAVLMEIREKIDLLLAERGKEPEPVDRLMPRQEFEDYMEQKTGKRPARQTVYDLVTKRKVPFEKHGGKYLYFRKSSIDRWLANGRQVKKIS